MTSEEADPPPPDLRIQSDADLKQFLERFGVVLPDVQVCAHHSTPWRAFRDAYFAVAPVQVWKASRGLGGKTVLMAALGLAEALTLRAKVTILGGSGQQSERVIEEMKAMWRHKRAPTEYLLSEPGKRITSFIWNNTIAALAASQTSVRGPHPSRMRCDEVDEMSIAILDAALGQAMRQGSIIPQTVLSSTHQHPDGTMTEVLKRAAERGWPVHEWCWRETACEGTGWLLPEDIIRKRSEVTETMWATEYDLQEPTAEGRAIVVEAIDWMFDASLGQFAGGPSEFIGVKPTNSGATYATGVDWAKKHHWTVILTLRTDTTPMRVAAFERMQRQPWPTMIAKLDERRKLYPGPVCHDALGVGDVVGDHLADLRESPVEDVLAVGRLRTSLFNDWIAAIERHEVKSPRIESLRSGHRYCTVDDLQGSGHPPDVFIAGAMAYRASKQKVVVSGFPQGVGENPTPWEGLGPMSQQPSILQLHRPSEWSR